MPAWTIMNDHMKGIPHCFAEANEISFVWASAAVHACEALGVDGCGSVGCLDRGTRIVVGFSGKLAAAVGKATNFSPVPLKRKMEEYLGQAHYQSKQLVFAFQVHEAIRKAMGQSSSTAMCAEKYIHSSTGAPILGMSVLWYGGNDDRFVPSYYESVSGDGFQFMVPCQECRSISMTMRSNAESTFGLAPAASGPVPPPGPGQVGYEKAFPALSRS